MIDRVLPRAENAVGRHVLPEFLLHSRLDVDVAQDAEAFGFNAAFVVRITSSNDRPVRAVVNPSKANTLMGCDSGGDAGRRRWRADQLGQFIETDRWHRQP